MIKFLKNSKKVILIFTFFMFSTSVFSASYTGKVSAMNVSKAHKGFWIQLSEITSSDKSISFEVGESCAGDWAFMSTDDINHVNMFMALALSAKSTGETVVISTDKCIESALGNSYPQLLWMDYGVRIK